MTCEVRISMIPKFKHKSPQNTFYEMEHLKGNLYKIWICFKYNFSYANGKKVKSCWGFYDLVKCKFYSPLDSKTPGKEVKFELTSPWSSVQVNKLNFA